MRLSKSAALGLCVVSGLAIALPGNAASGNKYGDVTATRDCGDGDHVDWLGPLKLWPPNHKFVDVHVSAVADDAAEGVTIEVDPVLTDVAGGDGGANHDPDWMGTLAAAGDGSATVDMTLRAERSGRGDGRTYTLNWSATFDDGTKTCDSDDDGQSPFVVSVPHDMRGGADWK